MELEEIYGFTSLAANEGTFQLVTQLIFITFDRRIGKPEHLIFFKPAARAKELHAFPHLRTFDDKQIPNRIGKIQYTEYTCSHILQQELKTTRCHPSSSNFLLRKKKCSQFEKEICLAFPRWTVHIQQRKIVNKPSKCRKYLGISSVSQ